MLFKFFTFLKGHLLERGSYSEFSKMKFRFFTYILKLNTTLLYFKIRIFNIDTLNKTAKYFLRIKGHIHDIFSLRIGLDKKGKSILTGLQTSIPLSKSGSLSIMSITFTSSVSESSISIKWFGRIGSSNIESCITILLIFFGGEGGRLMERGA